MTTTILTPLTEIDEGALIDLSDDPYATYVSPHFEQTHDPEDVANKRMDIACFKDEFAVFERIEREVGEFEEGVPFDQAVVYTSLTNFGCPLDHRLKVVTQGEEA
jgi:hypothetical protein